MSDVHAPLKSGGLAECAPELERLLTRGGDRPLLFGASDIRCSTVSVAMRDGMRLATDVYLPPMRRAPAIVMRTPYGRAGDKIVGVLLTLARSGYVVVSQDCRGTGESDPATWDYYMFEPEDGYDLVAWISVQDWFDGFAGGCGGSYSGQTQWCMARHPAMSTIVPEMSGLGIAVNTTHLHMFLNAYARSVGKREGKVSLGLAELERLMLPETLAGGYFNEPLHRPLPGPLLERHRALRGWPPARAQRWLWEEYCRMPCAERAAFVKQVLGVNNVTITEVEALPAIFGQCISHDAHTLPHSEPADLARSLHAAPLMITGWYDWALNDALATWMLLRWEGQPAMRAHCRLIITPSAHNVPGYQERAEHYPELRRAHRLENNVGLLLAWYAAVREGRTGAWPTVIYYLMGANKWQAATDWPPPETRELALYLGQRVLTAVAPREGGEPDRYTYDPEDPTPTMGGSILSAVYPPGSVDVSEVQTRADVLTYTTGPLERSLDVVGPLRLIVYASSSALDTDLSARVSDVFSDGRAIQLQSGILRARYRNGDPELLEPGRIYRLEIDLWATANRFERGHRVRLDISSADFPRFDRNTNRGGEIGPPIRAMQSVYHDSDHPSHLVLSVLGESSMPL
jgi:predicted acyl esterase